MLKQSLTKQFLTQALQKQPSEDIVFSLLPKSFPLRSAAVMIPLFQQHSGQWEILFTRRSSKVSSHKGEISFPGGRVDPEDQSPKAAALRETYEEVGIPIEDIDIHGRLPDNFSIAGYRMAPFVATIPNPFSAQSHSEALYKFAISHHEIDEVFSVPIQKLIAPETLYIRHQTVVLDKTYYVYGFRWKDGYEIWGATARILKHFLEQLYSPLIPINANATDIPYFKLPL